MVLVESSVTQAILTTNSTPVAARACVCPTRIPPWVVVCVCASMDMTSLGGYASFCSNHPPIDALQCDCRDWENDMELGTIVCTLQPYYCFPFDDDDDYDSSLAPCPNTCGQLHQNERRLVFSGNLLRLYESLRAKTFCVRGTTRRIPTEPEVAPARMEQCGMRLDGTDCNACETGFEYEYYCHGVATAVSTRGAVSSSSKRDSPNDSRRRRFHPKRRYPT